MKIRYAKRAIGHYLENRDLDRFNHTIISHATLSSRLCPIARLAYRIFICTLDHPNSVLGTPCVHPRFRHVGILNIPSNHITGGFISS